jgi:hypothetical protein
MDESPAGLADTLKALRAELNRGVAETPDAGIVFDRGKTEVELQVTVTKDASADGGVRFGVVSIGAKGSLANESVHRVLVTLQPLLIQMDESGAKVAKRVPIGSYLDEEPP